MNGNVLHRPSPIPVDLQGSVTVDKGKLGRRKLLVSEIGPVKTLGLDQPFSAEMQWPAQ